MSGINQHTILGNIGKIETRYTPGGKAIVNLSIATSEKWTDKNTGQKQEKTHWHNVVVFGKPAEIISQYCNKGDKLYLQGKVVTRKWQDTTGADRYSTETVVDGFGGKFELLTPKRDNSTQPAPNQSKPAQTGSNNGQQPIQTQKEVVDEMAGGFSEDMDDIPFAPHERFLL